MFDFPVPWFHVGSCRGWSADERGAAGPIDLDADGKQASGLGGAGHVVIKMISRAFNTLASRHAVLTLNVIGSSFCGEKV